METLAARRNEVPSSSLRGWWHLSETEDGLLLLRLSLLLILIHQHIDPLFGVPVKVLCGAMLLGEGLTRSEHLWFWVVVLSSAGVITLWDQVDNHQYLIMYWAMSCWIGVKRRQVSVVLGTNGRMLMGVVFTLAVLWKIIGGQYLDGSFWEFTLLSDPRLQQVTELLGPIDSQARNLNNDMISAVGNSPDTTVKMTLVSTGRLELIALMLSYGGILIEAAVALSFLLPVRSQLGRHRNVLLSIFISTTYFLLPVVGFATVLAIMGCSQVDSRRWRATYLLLIGVIQLAGVPWLDYVRRLA